MKAWQFKQKLIFIFTLATLAFSALVAYGDPPARIAVGPISQNIYRAVNTDTPRPTINFLPYNSALSATWTLTDTVVINNLPIGSRCLALAINADETRLYAAISAPPGGNSEVRIYSINSASHLPMGDPVIISDPRISSSRLEGLAIDTVNNRLYVTDNTNFGVHIINLADNSYVTFVMPADAYRHFDAVISNAKLFVSTNANPGRIISYDIQSAAPYLVLNSSGVISTGLNTYPSRMKIYNGRLYVSTHSDAGGVDIKVYDVNTSALVGTVTNPTGIIVDSVFSTTNSLSYGWTAFDISRDGRWLVYKKAFNVAETNNALLGIRLTDITPGSVATQITGISYLTGMGETTLYASDAIVFSHDRTTLAFCDSLRGNAQIIELGTTSAAVNHRPTLSNVAYYTSTETLIPNNIMTNSPNDTGRTTENGIVIRFDVFDEDGDMVIPGVYYERTELRPDGSIISGTVLLPTTSSGGRVTATLEGLANGLYLWQTYLNDGTGRVTVSVFPPLFIIDHATLPTPTITQIYPNRAPTGTTQNLVIEGTNFTGTPTVTINWQDPMRPDRFTVVTTGTGVTLSGTTRLTCALDLTGIALNTYSVTVSNPDGQIVRAINSFAVTAAGVDGVGPNLVANFSASDGESSQSTLTWTNPADSDLAEVVVRRTTGAYPTDHSVGNLVYSNATPRPGSPASYVNTGLTDGTTYYYAVFSRDTSGNWKEVVRARTVIEAGNADTGTPGVGGTGNPVTTITAARDGTGTVIRWTTTPAGVGVDIYALTATYNTTTNAYDRYFTTDPTAWGRPISTNNTSGSFTVPTSVGDGTARYYKLIRTGATLASTDLTRDVVGKFDLAVGALEAQRFFISSPLELSDNSLAAAIGGQGSAGDMILTFDIEKNVTAGSLYQSGSWGTFPGVSTPINTLDPGVTYGYYSPNMKFLTVAGRVRETNLSRTLNGGATLVANWIANVYPSPIILSAAGLNSLSAHTNPTQAGTLYYFDANAELVGGIENGIAFHNTSTTWVNGSISAPATLQLIPGKGYMLTEPVQSSLTWNLNRSY